MKTPGYLSGIVSKPVLFLFSESIVIHAFWDFKQLSCKNSVFHRHIFSRPPKSDRSFFSIFSFLFDIVI